MTPLELHAYLDRRLAKIQDGLGTPFFSFSIILRHKSNPDAHVLVSNDTPEQLQEALDQLKKPSCNVVPAKGQP